MKKKNLILLAVYLFNRIFIYNIINILFPKIIESNFSILELITYVPILLLILNNQDRLDNYNIDRLTILIFICGSLVPRASMGKLPNIAVQIIFWFSGIVLLVKYVKRKLNTSSLSPRLFYWVLIGIISGLIISIPFSLITRNIYHLPQLLADSEKVIIASLMIPVYFFYFIFLSVALEDTIYRGFLWGALRDLRISEKRIWMITSGLFWLSHFNYFDHPFSFWIYIPISSVLLGWLTYRSKACSSSLFSHAVINAVKSAMGL